MPQRNFSNQEIARLLANVAAAYEVKGESKFRVQAYQRAAVSIEHSTSELKDLWDDDKLGTVPGIGKNIASHIDELFQTGRVKHFDKVKKGLPKAMFVFLNIPGVGPKTAFYLSKNLKIIKEKGAIERLKEAALKGKIRKLENFGEKSELDILEGIKAFEKGEVKTNRMLLPYADILASDIISFLKSSDEVLEAHPLGSLRRMVATIGDIDISVSTKNPSKVIEHFLNYKKIKTVLERGEKALIRVILFSGQQVDIRFSRPESYGAMLQYFTGSKLHNIELRNFALRNGLSLSEYGIKIAKNLKLKAKNQSLKLKTFSDEKSFYKELGLEWIPPELREGRDEIEASLKGRLPKLVELKEIKGDLHVHSDFPIEPSHDLGLSGIPEIVKTARELGYEYLGLSEHNPSLAKHSDKDILDLLKKKQEYIEKFNYSKKNYSDDRVTNVPIELINGLEIDIKPNGDLSIPERGFDFIDFAIVSIHSSFNLSREKMSKRAIKGLSHPKAKILGHPTGRLLEEREGIELDWDIIFDFCLKNNKWLEISAWPNRLDLPDVSVREAVKKGVKLVIDSDSHQASQLANMKYGVAVARRGWSEKKDIINTLSYSEIKKLL